MVLGGDMMENIHFDQAPEPDTIILDCKKLEFDKDGAILLSLEIPAFIVRFNKIVFKVGDGEAVYKKSQEK